MRNWEKKRRTMTEFVLASMTWRAGAPLYRHARQPSSTAEFRPTPFMLGLAVIRVPD
jgi:hypothetical protein